MIPALTIATTLLRPHLKKVAVALLVPATLALGVWGFNHWVEGVEKRGWDAREAVAQQERLQEQADAGALILNNVLDAQERDEKARQELTRLGAAKATSDLILAQHLRQQAQQPNEEPNHDPRSPGAGALAQSTPARCDDRPANLARARLDALTVRVLDNARAGFPDDDTADGDPALGADAQGRAAAAALTEVTGADFAANDLQVVHEYHRLATRHDALVRWVQDRCSAAQSDPQP